MDALESSAMMSISLLTGGSDRPYVFGLTDALLADGVSLEMIGSDELIFPEFGDSPSLNFLNLRGSTKSNASILSKTLRISKYYIRLVAYAAKARPKIFHILWNNKFEIFDRTLLMLYYRILGKKIVFTVHNVNEGKRDNKDSVLNRLTLGLQYKLSHHLFVHTQKMKSELIEQFDVPDKLVTVIPFGINNAVPHSSLTPVEARKRLDIQHGEKVLLFFGRITPYKGLDYLILAFRKIQANDGHYRLLIAGRPDGCEEYWNAIQTEIKNDSLLSKVIVRADFIPDSEVEIYFKAADAIVLPYRDIYQSGVLFLGQSFGLPVLAADIGSFKDDIIEGANGFLFRASDSEDLTRAIEQYFSSPLYKNLSNLRTEIQTMAQAKHSWKEVSRILLHTYSGLLKANAVPKVFKQGQRTVPTDVSEG